MRKKSNKSISILPQRRLCCYSNLCCCRSTQRRSLVPAATLTASLVLLELLAFLQTMESLVFPIPNWMELTVLGVSPENPVRWRDALTALISFVLIVWWRIRYAFLLPETLYLRSWICSWKPLQVKMVLSYSNLRKNSTNGNILKWLKLLRK
jgi:hypothetical protein